MDMVTESVQLLPEKSRKKRRDRSNWKKEKLKQKRHKSKICRNLLNAVTLQGELDVALNKNIAVIGMLAKWLWLSSDLSGNVQSVQITFPVVGHSFLPPDRVFGRIEKIVKKKDTIVQPEEYVEIFQKFGTVRSHGHFIARLHGPVVAIFDSRGPFKITERAPVPITAPELEDGGGISSFYNAVYTSP
uniref:Uncharacterized protein n=1 Tax=Timema poppense TaxID=170557 RepID=A0A7R9DHV4_TIMPO|nr:unnamed protein product [Timema poppensis]